MDRNLGYDPHMVSNQCEGRNTIFRRGRKYSDQKRRDSIRNKIKKEREEEGEKFLEIIKVGNREEIIHYFQCILSPSYIHRYKRDYVIIALERFLTEDNNPSSEPIDMETLIDVPKTPVQTDYLEIYEQVSNAVGFLGDEVNTSEGFWNSVSDILLGIFSVTEPSIPIPKCNIFKEEDGSTSIYLNFVFCAVSDTRITVGFDFEYDEISLNVCGRVISYEGEDVYEGKKSLVYDKTLSVLQSFANLFE